MWTRSHFTSLASSIAIVVSAFGCSGTEDGQSSAGDAVWNCATLDASTLQCTTASTGTSDGTATSSGGAADGTGSSSSSTGTSDGTSTSGSGSSSGSGASSGGTSDGAGSSYDCTAGAPNCPPVGAKPGANTSTSDGAGDEGSNGGGSSGGASSSGGAGGAGSSGGTNDGAGGAPTSYHCWVGVTTTTCTGSTSGGPNAGGGGTAGPGSNPGASGGCTYTQGYWKTHPNAWPVTSLVLGGVSYTEAELLVLFGTAPAGDASLVLAHQLVAALLNGASGASPAPVASAVADAQAWMAANKGSSGRLPYGVSTSTAAGAQAVDIASRLDQYNNGLLGVAHCN